MRFIEDSLSSPSSVNPVGWNRQAASIEDVGVNHRRFHVLMAEEFLHSADIVATLQQMRSETMAEGVAGDRLVDSCQTNCLLDCLLQTTLTYVMAAHDACAWVFRRPAWGKNVLPDPFPVGMGMFAFQGKSPFLSSCEGQVNTAIALGQIALVDPFHVAQMFLQRRNEYIGQHRHPVFRLFAIGHDNLALGKIQVFNAEPHTFNMRNQVTRWTFIHIICQMGWLGGHLAQL